MKHFKLPAVLLAVCLIAQPILGCQEQTVSKPSTQEQTSKQEQENPISSSPTQPSNDKPAKDPQGSSNVSSSNTGNVTLEALAQQAHAGFVEYANKIKAGEEAKFNYAMISNYWLGMEAFHWDGDWRGEGLGGFMETYRKKVIDGLSGSPIYFTYTTSGLHILAIAAPLGRKSGFDDAVNQVRGDGQESSFLKELINYQSGSRPDDTYFAFDLYAEDLLHPDVDSIPIDGLELASSNEQLSKTSLGHKALPSSSEPGLDALLKKYNRTLGDTHALKNKCWNVYLFDPHAAAALSNGSLVIEFQGQRDYLSTHWL